MWEVEALMLQMVILFTKTNNIFVLEHLYAEISFRNKISSALNCVGGVVGVDAHNCASLDNI